MNSYSEVRRVRKAISEAAGHDVRKLAALFNERRTQVADRIIDPGITAVQCDVRGADDREASIGFEKDERKREESN